jgi:phage internal scaffolding protein
MAKSVMEYPEGANPRGRPFKVNYVHYPHEGQSFPEKEGLTQQEFKDECDINVIMDKYKTTGALPNMIASDPQYGDFSDPMDYQAAMNVVAVANEQFANLEAHIRARFDNDPQKFLDFATNHENAEEMAKMGLMKKEAVERVKGVKDAENKKKFDDAVSKAVEEKGKKKD